MYNPREFVAKICERTERNPEVCYDRYKFFMLERSNFSEQNFDYILQNFDVQPLINSESFESLSPTQHFKYLHLFNSVHSLGKSFYDMLLSDCFDYEHSYMEMSDLFPKNDITNSFPFENIRPVQNSILEKIKEYQKDENITDIIVDAPVGVGKSGIAIAELLQSSNGFLITANKALQNQYAHEFGWLTDLRGKSNYKCRTYEGYDCKSSPCQKTPASRKECKLSGGCDYGITINRALKNTNYTLLNMHAFITYAVYVPNALSSRNILIIDEAHSLPEIITSSVGLSLNIKKLLKYGIVEIPHFAKPSAYSSWLSGILEEMEADEDEMEEEDEHLAHKIKHIISKLNTNNIALDYEYDMNDKQKIVTLKMYPIQVEEYYNMIKAKGSIRIHLSATILGYETYCSMLGIKKENVAILRAGSPFHKENRPILLSHSVGYLNMSNLQSKMGDMVRNVESICNHYEDHKGIIHGVTYNICNSIYDRLSYKLKSRILYARSAKEQAECLSKHKESKNTILLSPSMVEGVDLKDDLSRFQIIAKVPYPYLGDPILQKRKELYYGYYESLTATVIMQAYGRSIRNENDWSHTFMLDSNFKNFVNNNRGIFPPWFLEAIVW